MKGVEYRDRWSGRPLEIDASNKACQAFGEQFKPGESFLTPHDLKVMVVGVAPLPVATETLAAGTDILWFWSEKVGRGLIYFSDLDLKKDLRPA